MKKGDNENHHQSENNVELIVSAQDSNYPVVVHKSQEKVRCDMKTRKSDRLSYLAKYDFVIYFSK